MDNIIATIAIYAIPVIFAITLHEAAHGYAAKMFGDNTAYLAGRISLNPLRHVDLMGTIVVPLALFLLSSIIGGGIIFGWAKPVPVNFNRLRNPKKDMFWVAAAGPGANLFMAVCWVLLAKGLVAVLPPSFDQGIIIMAQAGVLINIVLMVFNLLPIPPLDGGRIAVSLLPHRAAWQLSRVEPWGFMIILALIMSGVMQHILGPFVGFAYRVMMFFY